MRIILMITLCVLGLNHTMSGQFNAGIVTGYDLYQRYVNPKDGSGEDRSAGSALSSMTLGPKIWVGAENFSVSVESYANLGYLSFNMEDYHGMGAFSLPIIAKLNFKGLSGLNVKKKFGYAIGGGIQYNRTEFFGLTKKAVAKGIKRSFYKTYVLEVSIGAGRRSKSGEFFIRLGLNPELDANSLNIGYNQAYSFVFFKELFKLNVSPKSKKEQEDEIKNI